MKLICGDHIQSALERSDIPKSSFANVGFFAVKKNTARNRGNDGQTVAATFRS